MRYLYRSCGSLLICLVVGVGCSEDSSPLHPEEGATSSTPLEDTLAVAIPDSALRTAISLAAAVIDSNISLSTLDSISSLSASSAGIRDLTGIDRLRFLQFLDLSDNEISDLSPLGSLEALSLLDVSFNDITEIDVVRELSSLSVLVLDGNPMIDFTPLLDHASIKELSIAGVAFSDTALVVALETQGVAVSPAIEPPSQSDAVTLGGDLDGLTIRAIATDDNLWVAVGHIPVAEGSIPTIAASRDDGVTWELLADTTLAIAEIVAPDYISVSAQRDRVILVHTRNGWRISANLGDRRFIPPAPSPSSANYFPIVFPKVTMQGNASTRGWMTTPIGLHLHSTTDNGLSWRRRVDGVIDHSFDSSTGTLLLTRHSSLATSQSHTAESDTLISREGWRLLAAEFIGPDFVLAAARDGLERIDLETLESDTVLSASPEPWGAARIHWHESNPNIVHVVTGGTLPEGLQLELDVDLFLNLSRQLWRSDDAGKTWDPISVDGPIEVRTSASGKIGILSDSGLVISEQ